jgi:dUTP pyrophosphatase
MSYFTLLICPQNEEVKELYEKHEYFNNGDSGLDLFSPKEYIVKAGESVVVDFEIKTNMIVIMNDPNPEKEKIVQRVSYFLYARSSLGTKTPLRVANSVGIMDAGYTGKVRVCLDNIKKYTYVIRKGQRICQICAPNLTQFNKAIVDKLEDSERGEKGMGSTGL